MVARGVGRELAASVAAHRDILYRIQHPCGMIIPCFSPVVNTFFCGFGGSRNFRDIVTKTTGYSGVVWLKGRPGGTVERGEPRARRGGRGACPVGCRLTLPLRNRRGGLPCLSPAAPAFGLLCCPLSPRPALAERSSPPGKGEIFCFLMQGASPLASPGLNPGGTGAGARITRPAGGLPGWLPADLAAAVPSGGACLLCRLPTLPLVCFIAPYPPSPLPLRGRGRFFVFLCKGLRPLHPRG